MNTLCDDNVCNKIINEAERLIIEHGTLSFTHSKIITSAICSTREFYKYFSGKEDLLACILLRRSIVYDIKHFLLNHPELSKPLSIYVPALLCVEIAKRDPIYAQACVVAGNATTWQVASENKIKKLKVIDEMFFHSFVETAKIIMSLQKLQTDKYAYAIANIMYFYSMGKLLSTTSISSATEQPKYVREDELEDLLRLSAGFDYDLSVNLSELKYLKQLVIIYLNRNRTTENVGCHRCKFFNLNECHTFL
ncbi:TetR/AcrR family transcriptional regulator [Shewanella marina]|uniref:TetR/AcrR family transcriptional regulator n=1 Tax=Shewanella marina TaxID=487319 RepID=UPI000472E577|nr:helix-turn-helix domain-containing protein [Shewanella marina]